AVGEGRQLDLTQRHAQALGDLLGERRVRPPAEEHQLLFGDQFQGPPHPLVAQPLTPVSQMGGSIARFAVLLGGSAAPARPPPGSSEHGAPLPCRPSPVEAAPYPQPSWGSFSASWARALAQPSSIRAGTPLASAPAGTSPVTTAPAPV